MLNSTPITAWLIFLGAAFMEVGGDAVIRHGLRGQRPWAIVSGGLLLAAYGLLVNLVPWDFSKALGVYVAFFTLVSLLAGRLFWQETIPPSTWLGALVIMTGALIIQYGNK